MCASGAAPALILQYTAPVTSTRASRAVLAAGALVYAAAVAVASAHPGPRAWGLHLPGFLPLPERVLVLGLLFGGALLLVHDLARARASREADAGGHAARRKRGGIRFPRWSALVLLIPWAAALWAFRTRTHFLGDGTVWLKGLQASEINPFSEPLSAALWSGFASVLRAARTPIDAVSVGLFSILWGVLAAPILWGIATEFASKSGSRGFALVILATLGASQLFFGYIESYPPTCVAILVFLWLGLRRARGAGNPLWLAAALVVAVTSHLAALYLIPSYLFLTLRERAPLLRRAALAVLPLAAAAALLLLLGFRPARWLGSFQIAARAALPGHGAASLAKPYAALSLDHAWDLLNAALLVLPIPALLLLARAPSIAWKPWGYGPPTLFLAVAAASGLLMAVFLVLPVPPAQDWDLTSLLLLPLAILGVKVAFSEQGRVGLKRGIALAALGAGALLSFVLVNADEAAGVRRFESIIGPGAKVTAYGRAYGNELLASYHEDRSDHARALVHARRALDAEPTNPRYWIKVGAALYELGRFDEAIPVLEEAIRRGPRRHDGHYNLGNSLTRKGRYAEAVTRFRDAAALSEPRPDYLHNMGVALFYAGEVDSARAVWEEVVRRWPDYALSRRSLMLHFSSAPPP